MSRLLHMHVGKLNMDQQRACLRTLKNMFANSNQYSMRIHVCGFKRIHVCEFTSFSCECFYFCPKRPHSTQKWSRIRYEASREFTKARVKCANVRKDIENMKRWKKDKFCLAKSRIRVDGATVGYMLLIFQGPTIGKWENTWLRLHVWYDIIRILRHHWYNVGFFFPWEWGQETRTALAMFSNLVCLLTQESHAAQYGRQSEANGAFCLNPCTGLLHKWHGALDVNNLGEKTCMHAGGGRFVREQSWHLRWQQLSEKIHAGIEFWCILANGMRAMRACELSFCNMACSSEIIMRKHAKILWSWNMPCGCIVN